MTDARTELIVALDVPTASEARRLVAALGESVRFYKIGKQLFTAEGPQLVRDLAAGGRSVFLDLKFHDIPNTVAGAVRSAASLGVRMMTVHASGGSQMLRAAAEAAAASAAKPLVLAVTVLTSLDQAGLAEVGVSGPLAAQVTRLAGLALKAGCGGVVASAQEAAELRRSFGGNFAIVTPGIRPTGEAAGGHDQARVATPTEAVRAGATHIVVGRPITAAAEPRRAAEAILAELAESGVRDQGLGARD